jgi:uncharacterized protein
VSPGRTRAARAPLAATDHVGRIAAELGVGESQVKATACLIAEQATVPFIARYRKEATGGLDEVAILAIRDRLERLEALDQRRAAIRQSLEGLGVLTDELASRVDAAETLAQLEDVYLPFRPKRRTRAMIARERGLDLLAQTLLEGHDDPDAAALGFVDPSGGVSSTEEALAGARDVIAEMVSENPDVRAALRALFARSASISSRVVGGKENEGAKYRDYFAWKEPAASAPSHRVLAIRRGSDDGVLTYRIRPAEADALSAVRARVHIAEGHSAIHVARAVEDGYRRLLEPSLETELRAAIKEVADVQAIAIFAENLRNLLMASPLGRKAVLAIDPGLRTGCKVVALDPQGRLLMTETIFPLEPFRRLKEATRVLVGMATRFEPAAVAVGSGTGGREAVAFCKAIPFPRPLPILMVNESGASVYSASEVARQELPGQDVTVRGAVSIGRRLLDPLAELVKIDPKSIGVGQYQHDVDQKALKRALDDVVSSCVNTVGVEVNTASASLLRHVSGLSERLAEAIVVHRDAHGPFRSREDLLDVRGIGPRVFQQSAGFLRIRDGTQPLDASAVHPESYPVVMRMATDLDCTVEDLIRNTELQSRLILEEYVDDQTGLPTLRDIAKELAKPGRDPREPFDPFVFDEGVKEMADLKVGLRLPGIVTNVTAFGAFVDIGVHHDGLVHVSELADDYVRDPLQVVRVNQKVTVTVLNIDHDRQRIALSLRSDPLTPRQPRATPPGGNDRLEQRSRREERPPTHRLCDNPFGPLLDQLSKR